MSKLHELEELGRVSPVIYDGPNSYIFIQYSNLYLLALTRNNVNAVAILAFLHKLVEIFKHYFREVSICFCGGSHIINFSYKTYKNDLKSLEMLSWKKSLCVTTS
jgi:hypothetical protein